MRTLLLLGLIGLTACESVEEIVDNDNDSFTADMDCDDNNADINPNATEICDEVDNNCNGEVDEGVSEGMTLYPDTDDDGFGDPEGETIESCEAVAGYTEDSTDCNDNNSAIHPEANEICDEDSNIDENCNGAIDDDDVFVEFQFVLYPDLDDDGFGDSSSEPIVACHPEPTTFDTHVEDNTDCDDSSARNYPNATEYCDGVNNNCSGLLEDEVGLVSWTRDGGPIQNLDFSTGTPSKSKQVEMTNKGLLAFCPGTFYINLNLSNDITIQGHPNDDGPAILSGGDDLYTVINFTNETGDTGQVFIDNITITNGHASQSFQTWEGDVHVGGGVYCSGPADLSITNTNIIANYADYGGGLAAENCNVTMDAVHLSLNETLVESGGYCPAALTIGGGSHHIANSQISQNAGLYSGGLCMGSTDETALSLTMDNVQVYENHMEMGGYGHMYLFGDYDEPTAKKTIHLNDTTFFDNTLGPDNNNSDYSVINISVGEINLNWTASKDEASGLYGNDANGLTIDSSNEIVVDIENIDFGTELSGNKNQGDDLVLSFYDEAADSSYTGRYSAADKATIYCEDYLCGNNADGDNDPSDDRTVHAVGNSMSATAKASSSFFGGTILKGDTTNTLKNFSHFYLSPSSCTYDFYIFETADTDGDGKLTDETWAVIWAQYNIVHAGSGGYRKSPFLGMLLPKSKSISGTSRDMYYAFTVGWQCDAGAAFAQSYLDTVTTSPGDMGIGQSWGTVSAPSYSTANPYSMGGTSYGLTTSRSSASGSTPVYMMRVESIDLK